MKPKLANAQDAIDKQVAEKKAKMRKDEIEAREHRERTLANARKRPTLVESYNTGTYRANNLAKAQTLKKFIGVMKEAGMTDK